MDANRVSLKRTGYFSKLFLDYLNHNKSLTQFYKYPPVIDSFPQAIKDISFYKFNRKLLADVISEQYRQTNCQLPTASCQLLLKEDAYTLCTGHQLCLFTGPLYFIYKIMSAINLAEILKKKYPAFNFVPVYWMASEDHDFEEVNHVNVFSRKIEWKPDAAGSKQFAVGKMKTDTIKSVLDELSMVLGNSEYARELMALFNNAYLNQPDLASATRYLVNELFGKYGLLIIDGNDERLKNEMKEIFSDEIEKNTSFKLVSKTIQELEKQGYKAQVKPREINLFLLKHNERIKMENISDARCQTPDVLSPNVVTRPLYQQKILPNIAYVGGPAEISYWLEYKAMFDHYGVFFPALVPRNFATIIDVDFAAELDVLGLSEEDIFLSVHEMIIKYIAEVSTDKDVFNSERGKLHNQYKSIEKKIALTGSATPSSEGAKLKKQLNELESQEKKLIRTFKKKHEAIANRIEKIKESLFPGGELQERHGNFIPYYLKYGKIFIEKLKQRLDPLDFRFMILSDKK